MANYETLSHDAIEYLCGLIRDISSMPDTLISDITLASNQTMSSVKIDRLIQQCLSDSKVEAQKLVSALSHLNAEKITFEPTLDNTTDKKNTLLLYSASNDTNYTQYLRLENELINLGGTNIDLTGYITEANANQKFVLKTTYDDLATAVANKADSKNIPTKTSQLINDSGYLTETVIPSTEPSTKVTGSIWLV